MTRFEFSPADRPATHARVALSGPPGSGKTFSALRLASGFGGTIGVVDTRMGAANQYAHLFKFQTLPMASYDPADLIRVCAVAADAGIDNLIVSTWSDFWSGRDGMLEQVDRAGQGSRDKNAGWNAMRDTERAMAAALLGYGGNVLVTLKARIEWAMDRDERTGAIGPQPVGTKVDQKDGALYDFGVVLSMTAGAGVVTKARGIPALEGMALHHPDEDLAQDIVKGLAEGATGEPARPQQIRDWALDPARTVDDLRDQHARLVASGQTGAVVQLNAARVRELGVQPVPGDRFGDLIAIGDLLRGRAGEVNRLADATKLTAVAA